MLFLKNNELQLSLHDSDSLVKFSQDDIDNLEFKEAKKNKKQSSKGRRVVKVTIVSLHVHLQEILN